MLLVLVYTPGPRPRAGATKWCEVGDRGNLAARLQGRWRVVLEWWRVVRLHATAPGKRVQDSIVVLFISNGCGDSRRQLWIYVSRDLIRGSSILIEKIEVAGNISRGKSG